MAVVLNVNTFVRTPSPNDRLINIYNDNGKVIIQIDPYSSTFINKSKFVYILTDGSMSYDNVLQFASEGDAELAVSKLNDIKKIFIDQTNESLEGCGDYFTTGQTDVRYVLVTGDTMTGSLTILDDLVVSGNTILSNIFVNNHNFSGITEALIASVNPSSSNPYATIDDIGLFSGDTKRVKVSGDDDTEGYLIEKITGSTHINISKVNPTTNEILKIDVDLSELYTHTGLTGTTNPHKLDFNDLLTTAHTHNNFLSSNTTISDLSGYTINEINTLIDIHTGNTNNPHETSFDNLTSTAHTHNELYYTQTWIDSHFYTQDDIDDKFNNLDISAITNIESDFYAHTGNTNNPHETSFDNLTSTAHTHDERYYTKDEILNDDIFDDRYYTQTWIDSHYYVQDYLYTKLEIDEMLLSGVTISGSTSGLTSLFYTKSQVDYLLDGYSDTAHTHMLGELGDISINLPNNNQVLTYSSGTWINTNVSEITDSYTRNETDNNFLSANTSFYTQTEINTLIDIHTGNTNNPHETSFDNLISTAHTHDWIDVFNTPTTLSGYGITDVYTSAQTDIILSGYTLTDGSNMSLENYQEFNSNEVLTNRSITEYYVDGTSGSDDNDGLTSGTSFQTIEKVFKTLSSRIHNVNIKVYVAAGDYDIDTDVINTYSKNIHTNELSYIEFEGESEEVYSAITISDITGRANIRQFSGLTISDDDLIGTMIDDTPVAGNNGSDIFLVGDVAAGTYNVTKPSVNFNLINRSFFTTSQNCGYIFRFINFKRPSLTNDIMIKNGNYKFISSFIQNKLAGFGRIGESSNVISLLRCFLGDYITQTYAAGRMTATKNVILKFCTLYKGYGFDSRVDNININGSCILYNTNLGFVRNTNIYINATSPSPVVSFIDTDGLLNDYASAIYLDCDYSFINLNIETYGTVGLCRSNSWSRFDVDPSTNINIRAYDADNYPLNLTLPTNIDDYPPFDFEQNRFIHIEGQTEYYLKESLPRNYQTIAEVTGLTGEYQFVFCEETGLLYHYKSVSTLTVDNYYVLNTGDGGDTRYVSITNDFYTITESDSNFLSATTTVTDLGGYTTVEIDNNFLSANTSFYTENEVNNNFLSANTSFYTESEVDSNFLSATTTISDLDVGTILNKQIAYSDGSNLIGSDKFTYDGNTLKVLGDLFVSGTTTYLNTENVALKDNIYLLNSGETGAGITNNTVGFLADRGTLSAVTLCFEESSFTVRVGVTPSDVNDNVIDTSHTVPLAPYNEPMVASAVTIWTNRLTSSNISISGNDLIVPGLVDGVDVSLFETYFLSHTANTSNPHETTFVDLVSTPTSISGYGITDAYTTTEVDSNFLSGNTSVSDIGGYTTTEIDNNFLSGNTNVSDIGGYTTTEIDNNFLSGNTSVSDIGGYTTTEVDSNFLSGNTSVSDIGGYTTTEVDSNFLSASTSFGDVYGPTSSLDKSIVVYNGTTGKIIQDSGVIIDNGIVYSTGYTNVPYGDTPDTNNHFVSESSSTLRGIVNSQHADIGGGARLFFKKSRGSYSSPSVVQSGDYIGGFNTIAYDGNSYLINLGGIDIAASSVESGAISTEIQFRTSLSATTTHVLTITSGGTTEYTSDVSNLYTDRALVDKGYVTSIIPDLSKTLTVELPTSSEDITIFKTNSAITIHEISTVSIGTSPSITFSIKSSNDRSSSGTTITSGTTTSTTTGDNNTIYSSGVLSENWIWLETSATGGTISSLIIDIRYSEN